MSTVPSRPPLPGYHRPGAPTHRPLVNQRPCLTVRQGKEVIMFNYRVRYVGVLDAPSLSPGNIFQPSHVIAFRNLEAAEGLLDNATSTGQLSRWSDYGATDLDGQALASVIPEREATLTLYALPDHPSILDGETRRSWLRWADSFEGDPYPDYVLSIGQRGGIKRERVA